jgi:hypothetical protein
MKSMTAERFICGECGSKERQVLVGHSCPFGTVLGWDSCLGRTPRMGRNFRALVIPEPLAKTQK